MFSLFDAGEHPRGDAEGCLCLRCCFDRRSQCCSLGLKEEGEAREKEGKKKVSSFFYTSEEKTLSLKHVSLPVFEENDACERLRMRLCGPPADSNLCVWRGDMLCKCTCVIFYFVTLLLRSSSSSSLFPLLPHQDPTFPPPRPP